MDSLPEEGTKSLKMRGEGWGYIRIAWGAWHVLVCLGDDRSVIGNAHIGDECGGVSECFRSPGCG